MSAGPERAAAAAAPRSRPAAAATRSAEWWTDPGWKRELRPEILCGLIQVRITPPAHLAGPKQHLLGAHLPDDLRIRADKDPGGSNLLALQAEFVTPIYPWLRYVYFVGAFLTIFGTLYGTIEVAPTVLREVVLAIDAGYATKHAKKLRFIAVSWTSFGGLVVLVWTLICHLISGADNPPGLIAMLTPANLFTGVLACGLICLLAAWTDWKFLPRGLKAGNPLTMLNALAALIFLALGIKGYWDHSGWAAFLMLAATLALGWVGAWAGRVFLNSGRSTG